METENNTAAAAVEARPIPKFNNVAHLFRVRFPDLHKSLSAEYGTGYRKTDAYKQSAEFKLCDEEYKVLYLEVDTLQKAWEIKYPEAAKARKDGSDEKRKNTLAEKKKSKELDSTRGRCILFRGRRY
jgi:hypothetical protein